MAEEIVSNIRERIQSLKLSKKIDSQANSNSDIVINRDILENYKKKRDNDSKKFNVLSEIKSIIGNNSTSNEDNKKIEEPPKQENGNANNISNIDYNLTNMKNASIENNKNSKEGSKNDNINYFDTFSIKNENNLPRTNKKTDTIQSTPFFPEKKTKDVTDFTTKIESCSSNGKVQELQKEFKSFLDNKSTDKFSKENINLSSFDNNKVSNNYINKNLKNMSFLDNTINSKSPILIDDQYATGFKNKIDYKYQNSSRGGKRNETSLSRLEEDNYNPKKKKSLILDTSVKDKIQHFVHHLEKDSFIDKNGSKSLNKNLYPSNMKTAPKSILKKPSSTIDYGNASIIEKPKNSSTNKLSNYLSINSPKEINLFTSDSSLKNPTSAKSSNLFDPSLEVKNLTRKLKILTLKEAKDLDPSYISDLKNLANIINKLFK